MADKKKKRKKRNIRDQFFIYPRPTLQKKTRSIHTPQKKKRKKINPKGVPRASEITLSTRFKKLNYLRFIEITQ